ncbi:hypothetical protein GE061_018929 [Apolygus lucorum]|uniref:Uncharacterized protein n=1 Tax=Apolygus lucorum TaxID=248454 RepID=A0A6A4JU44_APOLU|nr:hypothetical protein GE061_018929 [Apolygus lucorum]
MAQRILDTYPDLLGTLLPFGEDFLLIGTISVNWEILVDSATYPRYFAPDSTALVGNLAQRILDTSTYLLPHWIY